MKADSRSDVGGHAARRNAVIALVQRRVERCESFSVKVKRSPPVWPTHEDALVQAFEREKVLRAWLETLGVLGAIAAASIYEVGREL